MTGHVGIYPDPLVLLLPVHHVLVGHVVLVVAPDDVIYRSLVQHRHHPHTLHTLLNPHFLFDMYSNVVMRMSGLDSVFLVKGGQEVGGEEVSREHADALAAFRLYLGPLLIDEALHFGEVDQGVNIRDLDNAQLYLRHGGSLIL